MPSWRRGPIWSALAVLAFWLILSAPTARALVIVDFDDLPSLSAASAADLGILSILDALVLSEADAGVLTGLPTANWATSGDQGILNTLTSQIVFIFAAPVTSFAIDVLGLPDALGMPTTIVLQAFRDDTPVALDISDVGLIGDSGFHEDTLQAEAVLGMNRVVLFPGIPCSGILCFDVGPTTSFWGDTVRYEPLPEPGTALLLCSGLAAWALRRRRLPLALLLAAGMVVQGGCIEPAEIVTPPDQTAVDATATTIPVEIQLGDGFGVDSAFRVNLLAGLDTGSPSITDISSRFVRFGPLATADLLPADLGEGRNSLFVSIDLDDDGQAEQVLSSSFSYEPQIDVANAAACDFLDPSHCLYPFPSNFHTREDEGVSDSDLRVDFHPDAMPANLNGVKVDPTEWNRNDGFSPGSAVQTIVPGLALETPSGDPAIPPTPMPGAVPIWNIARSEAPDASFLILDAETGERVLLWAELNSNVTPAEGQAVLLRPGVNLKNGRRYIAVLRNLRDAASEVLESQRAFRIYRDAIPTYVPAIEERRPHMEQIFAELATAGVGRDDLYLAWDFTVASKRNVSERMLAMRDDAFATLGANAPAFTVTQVEVRPATDTRIRQRVYGTYKVPLYVTNEGRPGGATAATRLYCEEGDGTPKPCAGDDLPVATGGFYDAAFQCVIPRTTSSEGADPVTPARPSLYGHGLLGSEREVGSSHVAAMAFEHNFVFCATRWIGMDEDDEIPTIIAIIQNFSKFPTLPDRMHQGLLNFLFLGRLMIHPDGFASHASFQAGEGDTAVIDPSELFYDGNSQGAIAGGALAAFAQDYERAVLGVPGMNYSTLLLRSVDFDLFFIILDAAYPDRSVHPLAIGLAQMLWDRTEANGHAAHTTADTYENTPAKKILLQAAFADFQVADVTVEVQARTLGASMHRPGFDPSAYIANPGTNGPRPFFQVDPYYAIPTIPANPPAPAIPDAPGATYVFDGSALVIWDSGNLQAPITNTTAQESMNPELSACALDHDEDPHECPRRQPNGRVQKSHFLSTGGAVVDVCAGQSCLAPTP